MHVRIHSATQNEGQNHRWKDTFRQLRCVCAKSISHCQGSSLNYNLLHGTEPRQTVQERARVRACSQQDSTFLAFKCGCSFPFHSVWLVPRTFKVTLESNSARIHYFPVKNLLKFRQVVEMHSLHMHLAETAKCLAQRISESRVIDLTPAEASPTTSGWENHEQQFVRRREHIKNISIHVESDFAGDLISRKSTAGLVAQGENGSALKSLTALSVGEASSERWRSGVFFEINLHGPWSSDGHRVIERLLDSTITDGLIGCWTSTETH